MGNVRDNSNYGERAAACSRQQQQGACCGNHYNNAPCWRHEALTVSRIVTTVVAQTMELCGQMATC